MICSNIAPPTFLIVSQDAPSLLYYSHIPALLVSLILGGFVYAKNRELVGKILFSLSIAFSLWVICNLIVWTNVDSSVVMFTWSFFGILFALISLLCVYFVYVFVDQRDISFVQKIVLGILLLPVIIFTPTVYNLSGFNFDLCGCAGFEEVIFSDYYYFLGMLAFLWILVFGVYKYTKAKKGQKSQIFVLILGVEMFLFSFFITGFLASFLVDNGYLKDFGLEQYGLFGMTFFMGMLAFLIVKFKAFDIKLLSAQALVMTLVILIGSELFFAEDVTNKILILITLALSLGFGYMLVKSVSAEIERKEELQIMADRLAISNEELRKLDNAKTEFISIASHQLRTPLTAIKGFVSLLLEGTYGNISTEAREAINKIHLSNERLIRLVEDLLNVSRIEAGRMIFEKKKGQFEDAVAEVCEGLELLAKEKGIYLDWKLPEEKLPLFEFDPSKMKEVVSNLVENAIKYTDKGGVTVRVERERLTDNLQQTTDNSDKVRFTVADTGIGIPADEIPNLFKKFSRGKNTQRLHVTGTGLGLFVVKNIVENHGGKIWIESKGDGMGAKFVVELPVEG